MDKNEQGLRRDPNLTLEGPSITENNISAYEELESILLTLFVD
jgi:hypothetical protein